MIDDTGYLNWIEKHLIEMGKYDATTGPRFEIIFWKDGEIVACVGCSLRDAIDAGMEGKVERR